MTDMGIFPYDNGCAAPTKDQRERYMTGPFDVNYFGTDGEIVLIEYGEAAYIRDEIDNVRILFTGSRDKVKAGREATRLADYHEQIALHKNNVMT